MAGLIARACEGDAQAFEQLIAQHQSMIYTFAFGFTGDPERAKDLAQEALVKVYRSLASFRFQAAFSTWLFAIVRNVYLDHHKSRGARQRQREEPLDEAALELLRDEATAEDQLLAAESRQVLLEALRRLPVAFREVVMMADVQGLDYDQIAGALGVPIGTVKSRLARGRQALRQLLFGGQDG
jgi:RNA polymerase sigma-70 factor (ECF subfamily)